MNLQQLLIFVTVVESGKLSRAAEKLQLKQPTLTFHLKSLQDEVGLDLFEANRSHRWIPTKIGNSIYHYAKQIHQVVDLLNEDIQSFKQSQKLTLQIGASETTASYILPKIMTQFKKEHDHYILSLVVRKAPIILEQIRNYSLHIGLIAYEPIDDPDLVVTPIMKDPLVLVMHPNHPLAKHSAIHLEELKRYPFILHEKQAISHILAKRWMNQNRLSLNIAMEIGSIQAIKEAVEMELGIAILPELCVKKEHANGQFIVKPLPQYKNERSIYLVHRKELNNPSLHQFMEFLQQKLKKNSPSVSYIHAEQHKRPL